MVDASRYDLEGNIKMTREIVEFAQEFDASVEGEIGCMGATEGEEFTSDQMKTNPQQALRFAQETGIDALAVSYGINKINVGCDFMNANTEAIKKHLAADPDFNFWVMMHQVEKESQELVKHYIRLSGSEGKSL